MTNGKKVNTTIKVKGKVRSTIRKIFKVFNITVLGMFIAAIIGMTAVYIKYRPTIEYARDQAFKKESFINTMTFKRAGSSVVLDNEDNIIANVSGNEFKYVELSNVSNFIGDGYIAVEDKDFIKHNGISYKGLARAGKEFIRNKGKVKQGGSTITQQLIKNTLLSQDKTISRKLTELLLAPKVEKKFTKSEILEFYINNCYYGEGAYGIESASQHFFSKPAASLSLAESATFIGMSNNPTMFNPTDRPEESLKKRNTVLGLMLENGKITQEQYDLAIGTDIELKKKEKAKVVENYASSYAVDNAVKVLMEKNGFNFKYIFEDEDTRKAYKNEYTEMYSKYNNLIRGGGYTLKTSIDMDKQNVMQSALDSGLSDFTEVNNETDKYTLQGSAVSIDNSTGYVVAIVGGRGEDDYYNRAFLSYRQPGSTIKPLLSYAPAFEEGYHPLQKMVDEEIEDGPANSDRRYRGEMTLRNAVEISNNTIPYRLLNDIRPKNGLGYLGEMRYSALTPQDNSPIASLGAFTLGVSNVEQTGGFYTLANKGYYVEPSCLKELVYLDEEVVYQNERKGKQVYSPEVAYIMTDVLKGVMTETHGTGSILNIEGQILAGKTGTTSENKDGWFCGYSAYYTTSVWVGYDMPRTLESLHGSTYPGRIWKEYMEYVHKDLPSKDWDMPSGVVMKNIDNDGNMVDRDTGTQDMFCQPILDRKASEDEQRKIKEAAARRAAWEEHEPARQENAESNVSLYETLHYKNREDIQSVNKAYNNAKASINVVDDDGKRDELNIRLQAHYSAIEPERIEIQNIIDTEEKNKLELEKVRLSELEKAKMEVAENNRVETARLKALADEEIAKLQQSQLKAVRDAEGAVERIEGLSDSTTREVIIRESHIAEDMVSLVADKEKHDKLTSRIKAVRIKFKLD